MELQRLFQTDNKKERIGTDQGRTGLGLGPLIIYFPFSLCRAWYPRLRPTTEWVLSTLAPGFQ